MECGYWISSVKHITWIYHGYMHVKHGYPLLSIYHGYKHVKHGYPLLSIYHGYMHVKHGYPLLSIYVDCRYSSFEYFVN